MIAGTCLGQETDKRFHLIAVFSAKAKTALIFLKY